MELLSYFDELSDPRRLQGQRYALKYVLFFMVLALLSNAKSYRNIEDFIESHLEEFKKLFQLQWKRAPDYTQIRNIVKALKGEKFEKVFRKYAKEQQRFSAGNKTSRIYVSFDGKALRGSIDNFNDKKAIQELFAYEVISKLVLGHIEIDEKSNEIPAVQELIKKLNLQNAVFTMDALHCQKKR